jgi:signal transduction histidine kinase/CheY-like chemotaxis protein
LKIAGTTIEREFLKKDGTTFIAECSIFAVELHGEYVFTAFLRDITERRELEQKLLQSEKLKSLGELAGGVAHNFNNILAVILGNAQLLKMNVEPPQEEKEKRKSVLELKRGLEIIENASRDGAEVVRRINEFTKVTEDKDHAAVNINEIIDHTLEFTKTKWKNEAESKGISFNIQRDFSSLPSIQGSSSELREVITNIINNALDAMPHGGEIRIKTFEEDSHVFVKIADKGTGIPRAIRDRVFDPFFTTKGPQSTGLGMSVSYGIINRHKGTLSIESAGGEGTTFTIKLPVTGKIVEGKEVKSIPIEQRKARILVIEDEEQVLTLLSSILRKGGHEVETATSGGQAIEIFENNEFDLVFTDLGMPGMSGWQVAEKIKGINRRVPVVLVTGWDIKQDGLEMKDSYIDLIIHKPFEMDQVLNLVQEGMLLRDRFKEV